MAMLECLDTARVGGRARKDWPALTTAAHPEARGLRKAARGLNNTCRLDQIRHKTAGRTPRGDVFSEDRSRRPIVIGRSRPPARRRR